MPIETAHPPGCPSQRIIAVSDPQVRHLRGYGKHLKLECGHEQWEAGFSGRVGQIRPCLSGCYGNYFFRHGRIA